MKNLAKKLIIINERFVFLKFLKIFYLNKLTIKINKSKKQKVIMYSSPNLQFRNISKNFSLEASE